MRCVSSRFLTALPRLLAASISSPERARRHGVLRAAAGGRDQPADGERLGALRANLDRHLIGRAADAAAADLDAGLHVVERVVEHADRLALGARLDGLEGAIDDAFGDGLLAVPA
jgi:hypothetical protein